LGYDPIFKPASQSAQLAPGLEHGHASLQGSHNSQISMSSSGMSSPTLNPDIVAQLREAAGTSGQDIGTQGYAQSLAPSQHPSAAYAVGHHGGQGLYAGHGAPQQAYPMSGGGHPLSAEASHSGSSSMAEEYNFPAIDPSLEAAVPGSATTGAKRDFDEHSSSMTKEEESGHTGAAPYSIAPSEDTALFAQA
jgi:hypothetical protein